MSRDGFGRGREAKRRDGFGREREVKSRLGLGVVACSDRRRDEGRGGGVLTSIFTMGGRRIGIRQWEEIFGS
nr:hypothetical protein CFP56_03613 [Quercus suber]POE76808.1 hypothetical protein CFP56_67459 [Quercus suber]POF01992.1 hypothetical protein CFP56_06442 [Quercus suber]